MKTSPWYTVGVGSMMKSANGPWVPVVPGTEGRTSAWWCNSSPSPPQLWGLNREPVLAWGSQMAHTAPAHTEGPVFIARGRNLSQVSKSLFWLGLRQENQRQAEGSPGREHSRTWPSRSSSPVCRLPLFITCSWEPFLHWWEVPLFTGMTALERCSLEDKGEMERDPEGSVGGHAAGEWVGVMYTGWVWVHCMCRVCVCQRVSPDSQEVWYAF